MSVPAYDLPATRRDLIDVMLDADLVSTTQVEAARLMAAPGQNLIDVLLAQKVISPRDVAMAFSLQLNLPLIELKRHVVQPQAIELVPEYLARRHNLIPLDVINGELIVVTENPLDVQALEDVGLRAGMRVRPAIGVRDDIQEALAQYYRSSTEIERHLGQIAPEPAPPVEPRLTVEAIAQNPVARVVELIINQAIRDRASDVHIIPDADTLRVRYRIDGILHDMLQVPLNVHGPLISRIKILAEMNIAERRRPQDGQFTFTADRGEVDVRVATAETAHGEMAVLRILDKSISLLQLRDLGFLPDALRSIERVYTLPFGMVLVSGPTGAGKTTTLYAMMNQFNRIENNLITIEDPIEYQFDRISQIQVNRQANITFATGLRAILRLDPNVILVGEIRDQETAQIAVQAALTGHLVLSSIHANDSVGALFRLIDLGVEPFLAASALVGIVAQRLVRKVCDRCLTPADINPEERQAYESELGSSPVHFQHGQGCNFCAETGYRGRTGVFEVLTVTESIRRLLIGNAGANEIRTKALAEGMVTMWRDGMLKARDGVTTVREVMRNAYTIR